MHSRKASNALYMLVDWKKFLPCDTMLACLQCMPLLVGRQKGHPACKKTEWWNAGAVICLGRGADLHMAQLMTLLLIIPCSNKSRLVLPSCFYLSGTSHLVVPDKEPLNGCISSTSSSRCYASMV